MAASIYGDKMVIDDPDRPGKTMELDRRAVTPEQWDRAKKKFSATELPAGSFSTDLSGAKNVLQTANDTAVDTMGVLTRPDKMLGALYDGSGYIADGVKAAVPAAKDAGFAAMNYAKNTLGFDTKGDEMDRVSGMGQRATLTPQAQAELANPGSQPELQPEAQPQVPEYLARPGTPQAMLQNAVTGRSPQSSESARMTVQQPSGGGGGGYGAGLLKQYDAAFRAEKDANAAAMQVGQRKAAEQAGFEAEKTKLMQQQAAQQAAFEDHAKTARDEQLAKVTALNDKLKAVDTHIDPDRFWASRGTGNKVMASIAVFLGGIGGGQNRAMDILQNAVTQDIEAQKATAQLALEKGQKTFDNQNSIYSQYLRSLGDDRAAMLASQVSALGIVQQRISAMGAKYGGAEQAAKYQQMNAAVDQKAVAAKSELMTRLDQLSIQRAELAMKREQHQSEMDLKNNKVTGLDPKLLIPDVGIGLTEKATEKVQEMDAGRNAVIGNLRQLIALRKQHGGEIAGGTKKIMESLKAQTKLNWSKMAGGGSMDDGMSAMVDTIVGGDVTSYFGSEDEALKALTDSVQSTFEARSKPYLARRLDAGAQLGITPR